MKKRRIWSVTAGFILCLLQIPLAGRAQNQKGFIQGVVFRGQTDTPVAGVRVLAYAGSGDEIEKYARATTTDHSGVFNLRELQPGPYSLRFSREGYTESTLG